MLLATKHIADMIHDEDAFYHVLISIVASSIGVGIVSTIGFAGTLTAFSPILGEFTWERALLRLLWTAFIVPVRLWITGIIAAISIRRSYDKIGLYFGSVLSRATSLPRSIEAFTKIFLIGFAIEFVAGIVQAIAFFSLSDQYAQRFPQSPVLGQSIT